MALVARVIHCLALTVAHLGKDDDVDGYMAGIVQDRFFPTNFFQLRLLTMSTIFIVLVDSIGSPGSSCLRDSGKLSFGPITSG